jgi:hypothetical protein
MTVRILALVVRHANCIFSALQYIVMCGLYDLPYVFSYKARLSGGKYIEQKCVV